MRSLIEVAICLDENMLLPAAVLLRSIEEHVRTERPVRVHALITFDPAKLRALAPKDETGAFDLIAIQVDDRFSGLPRNDYISQGTYLRFLLPDLLEDVGTLVYLDVDMIVHRELSALFDSETRPFGLAATSDVSLALGSRRWDHFDLAYDGRDWTFGDYTREVLGLNSADDYFNAGLLVIDLEYWRQNDVARRTLDVLAQKPKLKFMDQDALSETMGGHYTRLDTRWNAMANCVDKPDRRLRTRLSAEGRQWERVRALWRDDPWIIHYTGANKPWNARKPVALGEIWWAYARRSAAWPLLADAFARYDAICSEAAARDRPFLARMADRFRQR